LYPQYDLKYLVYSKDLNTVKPLQNSKKELTSIGKIPSEILNKIKANVKQIPNAIIPNEKMNLF